MRKSVLLGASLAALAVSGSAQALTLTSAAVFGVGGAFGQTVWASAGAPGRSGGNYTLFVSTPDQGPTFRLNTNDQPLNFTVANLPSERFFLNGDGFPTPTPTINSDPAYRLELTFDGGRTLSALYTVATNDFVSSTSFVDGGRTFSIGDFSYNRFRGNTVSPNVGTPGGDGNDYNGNFRLDSVAGAIPEPATWAMLIGGFGMVGGAMRRRRSTVRVTYA